MNVGRVELRKMSCNSHPTEVLKFSDWDRLQPEDVKLENVNEGWTVEGEQDVSSGCRVVLRCCTFVCFFRCYCCSRSAGSPPEAAANV